MKPAEPYPRLIARNVRAARAFVTPPLSQGDVAERMRELGFRDWRRQTVSGLERGIRRLTTGEALGLTVALETDLTALVYPPESGHPVSLPAGQEVVLPPARARYDPGATSAWEGNRSLLASPC